ncbi:RecQ mediated genome instability protein [Cryptosporidium felis]|nr:RecQ mediated genome instability protein [Cryptosporidium felis]
MNDKISEIESYLTEKYGIVSVIQERKQVLLEELEKRVSGVKNKKTEWKRELDNFVLSSDIRQYFLGDSLKNAEGNMLDLKKQLLVMVLKVRDCSRPKKASSSEELDEEDFQEGELDDEVEEDRDGEGKRSKGSSNKRMLYLTLTTGKTYKGDQTVDVIVNALEYEKFKNGSLNEKTILPGTKLLLLPGKDGSIRSQNSILLLKDENVKDLGGSVESLLESWKLSNMLSEYCSKGFTAAKNLTKKPPKFIPFANRESEKRLLSEQVNDAQAAYMQNKEAQPKTKTSSSPFTCSNDNLGQEGSGTFNKGDLPEDSNKAYFEFLERIREFKNRNLVTLDRFAEAKTCKDLKKGGKDSKKKKQGSQVLDNDLDPGAPVRGRFSERIDSDAREFLKSSHNSSSNITLFDHLFSKLDLGDGPVGEAKEEENSQKKGGGGRGRGSGGRGGGGSGGRGGRGGRGGGSSGRGGGGTGGRSDSPDQEEGGDDGGSHRDTSPIKKNGEPRTRPDTAGDVQLKGKKTTKGRSFSGRRTRTLKQTLKWSLKSKGKIPV